MKKLPALALSMALLLTACGQPMVQVTPSPSPEPTPEATATPEPTPPSKVYTDWSKLTPYKPPKPVYTRRSLIPADDYGELIPFPGAHLSATDLTWNSYSFTYTFYGLVTRQGEVVLDPILDSAEVMGEMDNAFNYTGGGSVLWLVKLVQEDGEERAKYRCALADTQGRWCTDFVYEYTRKDDEYGWAWIFAGEKFAEGIPMPKSEHRLALVSPITGEELYEVDYSPFLSELDLADGQYGPWGFGFDRAEGWCTVNLDLYQSIDGKNVRTDTPLLFDPNGNPVPLDATVQWVGRFSGGLAPAQDASDQWGYINTAGNWVIPPQYHDAYSFKDGYAAVEVTNTDQPGWKFIDPQGNDLIPVIPSDDIQRYGNYWYVMDYQYGYVTAVYDARTLEPVDSPLVRYRPFVYMLDDYVGNDWVACTLKDTGEWMLARGAECYRFPASLGYFADIQGDYVLFNNERRDEHYKVIDACVTLVRLDGTVVNQWKGANGGVFATKDGKDCIAVSYLDSNERTYYTLDGKWIASKPEQAYGDLIRKETDDAFELTTLDGETIFYWPIYDAID